jgi:inosose dehydratase
MGRRLAIVPILWNNDDLPELTQPETPYGEILSACARLGYDGVEMGSNFPGDGVALSSALRQHRLQLAAARFGPDLADRERLRQNVEEARSMARRLVEAGGSIFVIPEVLRPERSPRAGIATRADRASDDRFQRLLDGIHQVARQVTPIGVTCAFHNHAGSYVETEEEIERFLTAADPSLVKFCLDTGHATVGGADPAALARRHASRIAHVHLKDVDPSVLGELRRQGFGFLQGVRSFLFCELGRGCARIAETVRALQESGYDGWYVAEQDTSRLGAEESARVSHDFLASIV